MDELLTLWPLLLFWPAAGLSVLVATYGLARRRATPLLAAAVLVGPASAYLAATPRFFVWGLFPVGAYVAAAVAIGRNRPVPGAALVAATAGFWAWLALTLFA